jgi:hypothetical protein
MGTRAQKQRVVSEVQTRQVLEDGNWHSAETVMRTALPAVTYGDPEHWRCPDCGHPCSCSPEFRAIPHVRCGLTTDWGVPQ